MRMTAGLLLLLSVAAACSSPPAASVTIRPGDGRLEGYAGLTFNTDDGRSLQIAYDEITIYAANRDE